MLDLLAGFHYTSITVVYSPVLRIFGTGILEEGKEKLNVAVSGFVLAYVDREYEVGTPLTCTTDGYLTEIKLEDKMKYPERIVATYWKNEPNEEWGLENKKVRVNGRKWVKVK